MAEMLNILEKKLQNAERFVSAGSSEVFDVTGCKTIFGSLAVTVTTPSNQTFPSTAVDVTANTITKAAHGFLTGLAVTLTTTGGLPAGLATSTTYYVIKIDADTFKLASNLANALAGTAIDITTQGTGNDTAVVTALADASVKLQKATSSSGPWFDEGNSQAITVAANLTFEKVDPAARFYKFLYAVGAGEITVTNNILGKGIV